MELDDIWLNLDWDPVYLASIFDVDFDDMSDLWRSESFIEDQELLTAMENFHGCDVNSTFMEENSLNDELLCDAVE